MVDLSKGFVLGTQSTDESEVAGLERVYVSNWFSPIHLIPKGGTLHWEGVNPDKVKGRFAGKAIEFYLYADAEVIQKITLISGALSGQMPENPYAEFHDTIVGGLKTASGAKVLELDRPKALAVGESFIYAQIVIPDFDPAMVTPGRIPGIKWFWWEVTLKSMPEKSSVILKG